MGEILRAGIARRIRRVNGGENLWKTGINPKKHPERRDKLRDQKGEDTSKTAPVHFLEIIDLSY
jgi:hypothetical protein